jgi:uncharacterized protein (TIGR03066 family)
MRTVGVLVLLCAPLLLTGCGKKSNADLIVGKWQLTKPAPPPQAGDMTFEFTKDGKLKMSLGGKEIEAGTYKVDGDTVTTTAKGPDGKEKTESGKIKTLDDTTLIVEEQKEGKKETMEFKRK